MPFSPPAPSRRADQTRPSRSWTPDRGGQDLRRPRSAATTSRSPSAPPRRSGGERPVGRRSGVADERALLLRLLRRADEAPVRRVPGIARPPVLSLPLPRRPAYPSVGCAKGGLSALAVAAVAGASPHCPRRPRGPGARCRASAGAVPSGAAVTRHPGAHARREPFTRADADAWARRYPMDATRARSASSLPPPAPCSPVAGREGVGDSPTTRTP